MKKQHMNLVYLLVGTISGNIATNQVAKIVDKDGAGSKVMKYVPGAIVTGGAVYGMGQVKDAGVKFFLAGLGIGGGMSVVKQAASDLKINIPGLGGVEDGTMSIETNRQYFRPEFKTEMEYTEFDELPVNGMGLPEGFDTMISMKDETPALPAYNHNQNYSQSQFQGVESGLDNLL